MLLLLRLILLCNCRCCCKPLLVPLQLLPHDCCRLLLRQLPHGCYIHHYYCPVANTAIGAMPASAGIHQLPLLLLLLL
jgi:hypothetical protein